MSDKPPKSPADKRASKRVPFRHTVEYGQHIPPDKISIVTDLSDGGVCIQTNTVYKPGTRVYIAIRIGKEVYAAEGIVAWAKKAPRALAYHVKSGMGISFTRVEEALLEAYDKKLEVTAYVNPREKK